MSYLLLQGTATSLPLADATVQCIVTSPPYWGLRQYAGEQREVWGGDPCHTHDWTSAGHKRTPPRPDHSGGDLLATHAQAGQQAGSIDVSLGDVCGCGAWYGALGLEPTPWLYIEHIVAVCGELWRVLRADGVLWLNMGDTFYSGPDGGSNTGRGRRWSSAVPGTKNAQVAGVLAPRRRENINRGVHTPAQAGKQAARVAADGSHAQPNRARQVGIRPKSRLLMPHRVAIALADDGWIVRMDNVWSKTNPMPDSTDDRTTPSHEYVFQLVKSERYYYDNKAIREPLAPASLKRIAQETFDQQHGGEKDYRNNRSARGAIEHFRAGHVEARTDGRLRDAAGLPPQPGEDGWSDAAGRNARSVWTIATQPYPGAHFATFPEAIPERCILASSRPGDVVLDPFNGSGTTGAVALRLGRHYVGLDRSRDYLTAQALHRLDPTAGVAADTRASGEGQSVMPL